jgi:hypothetical protein
VWHARSKFNHKIEIYQDSFLTLKIIKTSLIKKINVSCDDSTNKNVSQIENLKENT